MSNNRKDVSPPTKPGTERRRTCASDKCRGTVQWQTFKDGGWGVGKYWHCNKCGKGVSI
jgi:hypothetical protein